MNGRPPRRVTTSPEGRTYRPPGTTSTAPPGMSPVQLPPIPDAGRDSVPGFDDEVDTDVGIPDHESGVKIQVAIARDRALLLRMDGALAGQVHALGHGPFRIGRHATNDLRVEDSGVSRFHACIDPEEDGHAIEDLDSRNGTRVNGSAAGRTKLGEGDWIQLGPRVAFRYSVADTSHEELLKRLFESSTRDALTGVYNRKHFEERLAAEIAYALRHGADVALVLFDIDHFKRVNDQHGHQIGDAVLRHLTAAAVRHLRTEDVLARFGGEEFAVILRGETELGAGLVAERLRAQVAALPAVVEGRRIAVTISAGCASLEGCRDQSVEELIAAADRRLYRAKDAGRNRIVATE
jgi:two-component system, cell cycle response regulator